MRILIIGAGAWGTALAVHTARLPAGHELVLWARNSEHLGQMERRRENARYLPGIPLPDALVLRGGSEDPCRPLAEEAELVVVATPVAGLRPTLGQLAGLQVPVVWLCKGFEHAVDEAAFGLLPHEVQEAVAPGLLGGALSGPSFAQELARGQPTAIVAASTREPVRQQMVAAFHSQDLRVYTNPDVIGVELGGAVKNVLAIATGLADGLALGLNARAGLLTRGLTEMTRLGRALGARRETFMGLSGVGDLVLTATGDLSRNRQVGLRLAAGQSLEDILANLGHVAEGVYTAHTVVARAHALGVEMPIAESVVALLDGVLKPAGAVAALMGRDPKGEML